MMLDGTTLVPPETKVEDMGTWRRSALLPWPSVGSSPRRGSRSACPFSCGECLCAASWKALSFSTDAWRDLDVLLLSSVSSCRSVSLFAVRPLRHQRVSGNHALHIIL